MSLVTNVDFVRISFIYILTNLYTMMIVALINWVFLQILKREWPKNWDSFIPDIIGASKTNESLCQNNMVILKLLSEEVFDFSCGQMTQTKAKHLKDTMCQQFQDVFSVCTFQGNSFLAIPRLIFHH